jgi:hypothetical protein
MRRDFLGTSFIRSYNGKWWAWHIVPDRFWIAWRYWAGAGQLNIGPLSIHWKSRRNSGQ